MEHFGEFDNFDNLDNPSDLSRELKEAGTAVDESYITTLDNFGKF